jgi:hypothetical protein
MIHSKEKFKTNQNYFTTGRVRGSLKKEFKITTSTGFARPATLLVMLQENLNQTYFWSIKGDVSILIKALAML